MCNSWQLYVEHRAEEKILVSMNDYCSKFKSNYGLNLRIEVQETTSLGLQSNVDMF